MPTQEEMDRIHDYNKPTAEDAQKTQDYQMRIEELVRKIKDAEHTEINRLRTENKGQADHIAALERELDRARVRPGEGGQGMNPDNYGSLPACKKLAEVLAKKEKKIETEFWWVNFPQTGWGIVKKADAEFVDRPDSIPAPSMAEVWRELPEVIVKDKLEYYKIIMSGATAGETYCGYFNQGKRQWLWGFNNTNPTDALIDLWVWVLQEGT